MSSAPPTLDSAFIFTGYLGVYLLAALACFGGLSRVDRINDEDTRRGLRALLVTSGGWALALVGFIAAPSSQLQYVFHMLGLIVGLSTLGPWLYFCSAFTGRTLHRNPTYRRLAVAVFLGIVAVKLTNPVHELYFRSVVTTEPLSHLRIQNGILHWVTEAFAYVLAGIGYFMLFETLEQVDYDTRPLVFVVGLTGLPVVFDIVAEARPNALAVAHEPLGVALFAIGFLFVFTEQIQMVQLASEREEPTIVLDGDDSIRDHSVGARRLFPELEDGIGRPIADVLPEVTDSLDDDTILTTENAGGTRYYRLSATPFSAGQAQLGRMLVVTDVTDREQYRRELERQNERLEQFASMVSHDLRNPLNVATLQLDVARRESDSESLTAAANALDRMEALIEDVLTLARQGQPLDEREQVTLSAVAERAWGMVDTDGSTLTVESDQTFEADPSRLQQLFENLFRNSREHGGDTVTVGALDGAAGFFVADDGPGIPADEREEVFESGYTTETDGTGFGLSIVTEIVDAHQWEIRVTESADGGARFEVRGLTGT